MCEECKGLGKVWECWGGPDIEENCEELDGACPDCVHGKLVRCPACHGRGEVMHHET